MKVMLRLAWDRFWCAIVAVILAIGYVFAGAALGGRWTSGHTLSPSAQVALACFSLGGGLFGPFGVLLDRYRLKYREIDWDNVNGWE